MIRYFSPFRIFAIAIASGAVMLAFGSPTFAASGTINVPAETCFADAAGPTVGNIVISGINARITYAVAGQSGKVNAVCHFEDTSGVYESMAEQQQIDSCTIILPAPYGVVEGSGHVVASAKNQADAGGNAKLFCTADLPE